MNVYLVPLCHKATLKDWKCLWGGTITDIRMKTVLEKIKVYFTNKSDRTFWKFLLWDQISWEDVDAANIRK